MTGEPKILLATLWHRTSERGNEYLSGYLGKARIIGFRGEPTESGIATWNLYLQPGNDQAASRSTSAPRQRRASAPVRERGAVEGDGRPFDDSLEDIGR